MLNKIKKDNKGFTIIEVLIVLAIAGLIMLVVFLAVPNLQRGARNSQRQADVSKITTSIADCLANRNGDTTKCNTQALLVSNGSLDTSKLKEITTIGNSTNGSITAIPDSNYITVNYGFAVKCNDAGDGIITGTANGVTARQSAVYFRQENTGVGLIKCIDV